MKKWLGAIACAVTVSACTAPQNSPPSGIPSAEGAGICDAANVQSYLGSMVTEELGAKVLSETGSRILRWIPPRSAVTMDYRTDRVSISYDDQRMVTAIRCG